MQTFVILFAVLLALASSQDVESPGANVSLEYEDYEYYYADTNETLPVNVTRDDLDDDAPEALPNALPLASPDPGLVDDVIGMFGKSKSEEQDRSSELISYNGRKSVILNQRLPGISTSFSDTQANTIAALGNAALLLTSVFGLGLLPASLANANAQSKNSQTRPPKAPFPFYPPRLRRRRPYQSKGQKRPSKKLWFRRGRPVKRRPIVKRWRLRTKSRPSTKVRPSVKPRPSIKSRPKTRTRPVLKARPRPAVRRNHYNKRPYMERELVPPQEIIAKTTASPLYEKEMKNYIDETPYRRTPSYSAPTPPPQTTRVLPRPISVNLTPEDEKKEIFPTKTSPLRLNNFKNRFRPTVAPSSYDFPKPSFDDDIFNKAKLPFMTKPFLARSKLKPGEKSYRTEEILRDFYSYDDDGNYNDYNDYGDVNYKRKSYSPPKTSLKSYPAVDSSEYQDYNQEYTGNTYDDDYYSYDSDSSFGPGKVSDFYTEMTTEGQNAAPKAFNFDDFSKNFGGFGFSDEKTGFAPPINTDFAFGEVFGNDDKFEAKDKAEDRFDGGLGSRLPRRRVLRKLTRQSGNIDPYRVRKKHNSMDERDLLRHHEWQSMKIVESDSKSS